MNRKREKKIQTPCIHTHINFLSLQYQFNFRFHDSSVLCTCYVFLQKLNASEDRLKILWYDDFGFKTRSVPIRIIYMTTSRLVHIIHANRLVERSDQEFLLKFKRGQDSFPRS